MASSWRLGKLKKTSTKTLQPSMPSKSWVLSSCSFLQRVVPFRRLLSCLLQGIRTRIRIDGLSAREVWTQKDQISAVQLPITGRQLILNQNSNRADNHVHRAKSKAHGHSLPPANSNSVYLKDDRDKCRALDRYTVT